MKNHNNKNTHMHPETIHEDVDTDAVHTMPQNADDHEHETVANNNTNSSQPTGTDNHHDAEQKTDNRNIIEKAHDGTVETLGDLTQGISNTVEEIEETLSEAKQQQNESSTSNQ